MPLPALVTAGRVGEASGAATVTDALEERTLASHAAISRLLMCSNSLAVAECAWLEITCAYNRYFMAPVAENAHRFQQLGGGRVRLAGNYFSSQ